MFKSQCFSGPMSLNWDLHTYFSRDRALFPLCLFPSLSAAFSVYFLEGQTPFDYVCPALSESTKLEVAGLGDTLFLQLW